jgi:23S rRNA (adenine2503-C2)-methyltransferase
MAGPRATMPGVTDAQTPDAPSGSPRPTAGPARDPRPGLSGLEPDVLAAWFADRSQPAYRARQVADAVWASGSGGAQAGAEVRTLPAALRNEVDAAFRFDTLSATELRPGDGGQTEKALHRLSDGALVESVLMHYPARGANRERDTVCISSQAGCAVGCPFCATGELGFTRDLETAEIVDQVRSAARRLTAPGRRLTNVVFMGMGEPLLNLDRVLEAVTALSDPRRFGLGARHITVSTSGVVPGMRRLTALGPQFNLAVSLHAARDPLRDVLVPLNRRWPVGEVVAAARDHAETTGRRISYEVTLIDGVNDTPADAAAMAELLRGDLCHVNLIPMNSVAHTPWRASPMDRIEGFAARLRQDRIAVTIRRNRGQEIGAACGQLAAERAGEPAGPVVARRRELLVRESAAALRAVGG